MSEEYGEVYLLHLRRRWFPRSDLYVPLPVCPVISVSAFCFVLTLGFFLRHGDLKLLPTYCVVSLQGVDIWGAGCIFWEILTLDFLSDRQGNLAMLVQVQPQINLLLCWIFLQSSS